MKTFTKITLLLGALPILSASCDEDPRTTDNPTLEIAPATDIVFDFEGSSDVKEITVTTNQPEWDYAMTPENGDGWLTAEKTSDKLTLTAQMTLAQYVRKPVTIEFTAGKAPKKTITVSLKQTDTPDPDDGIYSIDDLWPDDENPEGIVFWIDPASSTDGGATGTAGWVMGLEQAPHLAWCLNSVRRDFGTNSDIDGRLNWEALWAYDAADPDFTGSFQVFNWCRDTYGDPWYIPSVQELRRFFAVYAGLTPEQTLTYINGRRQFSLDQTFGAGTWASTEDHRRAYDMNLITAGGDGLWNWDPQSGSPDPELWTSTKYDVDMPNIEVLPWYVGFLGDWGSSSTTEQTSGNLARAMRRFGAETTVDQLSATPTSLSFEAVDTSVKTVSVTTTAAEYGVTANFDWIHITKSADSFTVTVDEYTAEEAELVDYFIDHRTGWITVTSGNAPSVPIELIQSSPAKEDLVPLDFTGTWNWTGKIWDQSKNFTEQSGAVEAAYNEELGYWIFSTIPENLAMSDLFNGGVRIDGGVALHVGENNDVTFVTADDLDMFHTLGGFMWRWYINYATFFDNTNTNLVGTAGITSGTSVAIEVSDDGNTITFPTSGIYDGFESVYGFGFGYLDTYEEGGSKPDLTNAQPAAIYRDLVFTRSE